MTVTQTDFPAASTSVQTRGTVQFGVYTLDLQNEQVWCEQQPVRLTGKSFAVLRYFVEHPNQLVTKRELFRAVWSETIVSHSTLTSCIKELRKALGDDARAPHYIETVHRRGYRFLPTITTQPVLSLQLAVCPSDKVEKEFAQLTTDDAQLTTFLVSRDTELSPLQEWFVNTLRGKCQIVFVTDNTGSSNTARLEVFVSDSRSRRESPGTAR